MSNEPLRGDELTVDVGERLTGKTTRLVEWVLDGERAAGYPGWSRVLVVTSLSAVLRLRRAYPSLHPKQVYHLWDWQQAHCVSPSTEVAIDDVDRMLWELLRRRGVPVRVALSGRRPEAEAGPDA